MLAISVFSCVVKFCCLSVGKWT